MPRLGRGSGDPLYDRSGLAAVGDGLQRWAAGLAGGAACYPSPGPQPREGEPVKLRVQFRLVRDIPALNLIGPVGSGGTTGLQGGAGVATIKPE